VIPFSEATRIHEWQNQGIKENNKQQLCF
jgi:hypothetical protein